MNQRPIDYLARSDPLTRTIVAGGGLVLIGVLWILADRLTIAQSNQIALFSAFLSGILTFLLIWIYLKIAEETIRQTNLQIQVTEIQSQQSDIMERQEELMEFQYMPRVRLRDYELLCDNGIELTLVNVGNGLAERMFLRTMIFVRPEPDELAEHGINGEVITLNDQELTLQPGYSQLVRDEESIVASDLSGDSLRPDESEVRFKSKAQFGVKLIDSPENNYGFTSLSRVLNKIQENGHGSAHIELSVVYSDIKGGIHTEYIFGRTVSLEAGDRELRDLINTDFVTHWSPMDDEERNKMIENSEIYPDIA